MTAKNGGCISSFVQTSKHSKAPIKITMSFFNSAVDVLQTIVIALGSGLGIWGVINLLEGYGNDNPGAKSQDMKQLMAKYLQHLTSKKPNAELTGKEKHSPNVIFF